MCLSALKLLIIYLIELLKKEMPLNLELLKNLQSFFSIEDWLERRESSIKDLEISKVVIFSELIILEMMWKIILSWGLGNFYQLREKKEYN